jgi:hypothetical protein
MVGGRDMRGEETYYDWFDHKWRDRPRVIRNRLCEEQKRLIDVLFSNVVQNAGSAAQLYAGLLARTLVSLDPELMQRYGRYVARRTGEPIADGEGQRCGAND